MKKDRTYGMSLADKLRRHANRWPEPFRSDLVRLIAIADRDGESAALAQLAADAKSDANGENWIFGLLTDSWAMGWRLAKPADNTRLAALLRADKRRGDARWRKMVAADRARQAGKS